jgi:NAD(P)-dependent dehydrogenase (short-subunit alcohol dehydrogenase family)
MSAQSEAKKQRSIQRKVKADDRKAERGAQRAMQAGARLYPVPPFPKQHLPKPGEESQVVPAPLFDAPYYKGSGKLAGKVALITGGDSGIGRAVAVLYAREGADIAISYLNEHRDADLTREAVEGEGRTCVLLPGNIADRKISRKVVADAVKKLGRLDILVNNAAFQVHSSDFADLTEAHFDTTLKTNLYGYFHMSQAAIKHMQPGSAIINTGSVTGIRGSKALVDYSMTKGGIHAFTRALAANLIDRGIRVNAVAPGPVWTPLNPRQGAGRRVDLRGQDADEAAGPTRGDRPGLCLPRLVPQLHHRRDLADHRRILTLIALHQG